MEALAGLLTRERVLVELLVFKLVNMRQLLLAGETRFLPWAAEEVERATEAVRHAELERALLVASISAERGLVEPALTELLQDAPDPWRSLLLDTHAELCRSAREVQELIVITRRLAEVGVKSLADALGTGGEPALATYGRDGSVPQQPTRRWEQVL